MKEDLYLTSNAGDNAVSFQNIENGLVVGVFSTHLENPLDKDDIEIWTAKPISWIDSEQSPFTSYSEVERSLEQTRVFTSMSLLPQGIYAISVSEHSSTAGEAITAIANALEYSDCFNPIILD